MLQYSVESGEICKYTVYRAVVYSDALCLQRISENSAGSARAKLQQLERIGQNLGDNLTKFNETAYPVLAHRKQKLRTEGCICEHRAYGVNIRLQLRPVRVMDEQFFELIAHKKHVRSWTEEGLCL